MTKNNLLRPSIWVIAGALMAMGLAGCDQKKDVPAQASNGPALPLTTGPATAVVTAPAASALPAAPRVRIGRVTNPSDRYAYVDRATEMSDAIGQAPPDYGFDYDGVHPWVWRGSNREVRLVEPVEGGYRYYFYRPGASEPYLVRDTRYSYGFSDGQLVIVYDNDGRALPPEYVDRRADDASRYFARATALYDASLRRERRSVNAANWAARRDELDAERSRLEAQQNQQDDWRSYHAQHEAEDQAYWRGERDQRDRSARSFNDWQSRGYNGPPPPPVDNARHDERNDRAIPGQGPSTPRAYDPGEHNNAGGPPPGGPDRQGDGGQQMQQQRAQAEAARAQQKAQTDAAQQAQVNADAARQAKAAADASALALQQRAQADAAHAQQKAQAGAAEAKANAARQAKAAADASALALQQRAQADAAHAQQKAQADAAEAKANAARQAKAAADASALAQQQRAQADAARAQQKARADAAQQAAAAAVQAQPKAAHPAPSVTESAKVPLPLPATVQPTKEQIAARRAAAKKAYDDAHPDAAAKSPAQP